MSDSEGRTRLAALMAAGSAAVLLLGAVAYVLLQAGAPADRFAACREVQTGGVKLGGPFVLTAQDGQRMSDGDLLARGPALIYFGYTFCPDVCPVDVARNVAAVDLLAERGLHVIPVFITVDPARDTVAALADYAEAMHPDMVALTGTEDELKPVEAAFGVTVAKESSDDPDWYTVGHTTLSYLVLPGEGVVALFSRRQDETGIADRIACYLEAAG